MVEKNKKSYLIKYKTIYSKLKTKRTSKSDGAWVTRYPTVNTHVKICGLLNIYFESN